MSTVHGAPKKKVKIKLNLKRRKKPRPAAQNDTFTFDSMIRQGDTIPEPDPVHEPAALKGPPVSKRQHSGVKVKIKAGNKKKKKVVIHPTPDPVGPIYEIAQIPADFMESIKQVRELETRIINIKLDQAVLKQPAQNAKKRRTTRQKKERQRSSSKQRLQQPPPRAPRGSGRQRKKESKYVYDDPVEEDDGEGYNNQTVRRNVIAPIPRVKKTKMNHLTPVQKQVGLVIDKMLDLDRQSWFQAPVPNTLPGYHDKISHPMDLGTIRGKLSRSMYNSFDECHSDIELVFTNCLVFNGPDAAVSLEVKKLKSHWDKKCVGLEAVAGDWHVKKLASSRQRAPPRQKRAATARKKQEIPVTYEQKVKLVEQIGEAGEKDDAFFGLVVQILAEHKGVSEDDEDIELDVEELPDSVLRKLQTEVRNWRISHSLYVEPLPVVVEPSPPPKKKSRKKAAPKSRRRSSSSQRYTPRQEPASLNREEMLRLAEETRKNTESQLAGFRDELKRLSGKVVQKDHNVEDSHRTALPAALAPIPTVVDASATTVAKLEADDDEDTFSSGDDAPNNAPVTPAPGGAQKSPASVPIPMVIENTEGWKVDPSALLQGSSGTPTDEQPKDEMWQKYQVKQEQIKELAEAEAARKEKLRQDIQATEAEQRQLDVKRKAEADALEKQRLEQEKLKKEELMRQREVEREQQRLARESEAQSVIIDESAMMMGGYDGDAMMFDMDVDMDLAQLRGTNVEEGAAGDEAAATGGNN